jgi:hypothetical protein
VDFIRRESSLPRWLGGIDHRLPSNGAPADRSASRTSLEPA